MPHIVVHQSGESDAELTRTVVDRICRLTQDVLGKSLDVIAIEVVYVASDDWFIGGTSLTALGRVAFNLDISLTDETNTKAEKASYVREVFAAMTALHPNLHDVSYVT